jgi:hypothetical protein
MVMGRFSCCVISNFRDTSGLPILKFQHFKRVKNQVAREAANKKEHTSDVQQDLRYNATVILSTCSNC